MSSWYHWDRGHPGLTELRCTIEPEHERIVAHPVYRSLGSRDHVITFMENYGRSMIRFHAGPGQPAPDGGCPRQRPAGPR